jgi:hypothetical protein
MLDHERVARTTPRGRDEHGLAGERGRMDQVEQVLEKPRIGTLVDRRADDHGVRLLDRVDDARRRKGQVLAPKGRAQTGACIDEIEDVEPNLSATHERLTDGLDKLTGLRGPSDVAGEADDVGYAHGKTLLPPARGGTERCNQG